MIWGKLPAHGDFVSRGLKGWEARALDGWIAEEILAPGYMEAEWPLGGLRLIGDFGGSRLGVLMVPSADRAGRLYPLAALVREPGGRGALDDWARRIAHPLLDAVTGRSDADALEAALISQPCRTGAAGPDLWTRSGGLRTIGQAFGAE